MDVGLKVKTYRSPRYKLVRFFERSRDGWKRKCQMGKVRIRRLSARLQKLKVSRDRWKVRAKGLRDKLAQVEVELEQLKIGG